MNDRDRLEQLRGLLHRLERMPASAERDRTLAEVRARVVDVETGTAPTPMRRLPRDEPAAELASDPPRDTEVVARAKTHRKKSGGRVRHTRRVRPALQPPSVRERLDEEVVDLLHEDGVMSLGEPPAAATAVSRPWSGGLRG